MRPEFYIALISEEQVFKILIGQKLPAIKEKLKYS